MRLAFAGPPLNTTGGSASTASQLWRLPRIISGVGRVRLSATAPSAPCAVTTSKDRGRLGSDICADSWSSQPVRKPPPRPRPAISAATGLQVAHGVKPSSIASAAGSGSIGRPCGSGQERRWNRGRPSTTHTSVVIRPTARRSASDADSIRASSSGSSSSLASPAVAGTSFRHSHAASGSGRLAVSTPGPGT
jgi:hypothetical protein